MPTEWMKDLDSEIAQVIKQEQIVALNKVIWTINLKCKSLLDACKSCIPENHTPYSSYIFEFSLNFYLKYVNKDIQINLKWLNDEDLTHMFDATIITSLKDSSVPDNNDDPSLYKGLAQLRVIFQQQLLHNIV